MYELELKPYLGDESLHGDKSFTFEGDMKMHFKCVEPTNKLIFHSNGLNFHTDSIELESNDPTEQITINKRFKIDAIRIFVIFDLSKECTKDVDYTFRVKYDSEISRNLYGFYLSSFTDLQDKTSYLAVTDFQPT